jgi:hypothetical protein
MSNIFVSYRREDTAGHAGHLCNRLRLRFPQDQIFIDVDTIKAGVDFVDNIEEAVGSCDVLLAMIGAEWLTVTDKTGARRLENPKDFNRIEIAVALKRKIPVVPVLVDRAQMPDESSLPEDLAQLSRIQAHEISQNRWDYDFAELAARLEELLGSARRPPVPDRTAPVSAEVEGSPVTASAPAVTSASAKRRLAAIVAVPLVVALAAILFLVLAHGKPDGTKITAAAVAAPAIDASGRTVTYEPENAIDSDPSTAWRADGDGHGIVLSLDFGRRISIRRIGLLPGYAKVDPLDRTDRFAQNRRIVRVKYRFDGGASSEQTFVDSPVVQFIDTSVATRRMTVEILETTQPGNPRFDYTAISEIQVDTTTTT